MKLQQANRSMRRALSLGIAAIIGVSMVGASGNAVAKERSKGRAKEHAKKSAKEQVKESTPDMLERTLPAIVTVGVYKAGAVSTPYGFTSKSSDSAYEKALDLAGAQASGSGFIISYNGKRYIVTNAHVIETASDEGGSLYAFSINRTRYPVRVIGGDSFYDVAVLEFTDKQPGAEAGSIEFRPAEARIGETVFAIGNPLGQFPYTVTQGIIGGKNRVRDGLTGKFGYLQSSATTIWGNSGGPLVDSQGKVIGINSQIEIAQRSFGSFVQPQLNFALEANLAKRLVTDIIEKGRVMRAYLGVAVTQAVPIEAGGQSDDGPVIAGAVPGSPAAVPLAGKEGYLLTRVNGRPVRNVEEALGELEKVQRGSTVSLELKQNAEPVSVKITAGELTPRHHGELASYFLRSFAGLDASRGEAGVVVTAANCAAPGKVSCGKRVTLNQLDFETDSYLEMDAPKPDLDVFTAGFVRSLKEEKFTLWKVRNSADLGLVIRLTALNGFVSFIGTSGGKKGVETLMLTDDGRSVLRTLLY